MRRNYKKDGVPFRINHKTLPALTKEEKRNRLAKLRSRLKLADSAFADPNKPQFPDDLLDIPDLIAELQPTIGKARAFRVPFWKCAVAIDHAFPGLALRVTLDELVKRACDIPCGPLVKLMRLQEQGHLSRSESLLVDSLKHLSEDDLRTVPTQPTVFTDLLTRVASPDYQRYASAVQRRWPKGIRPAEIDSFMAFAIYQDFIWQHQVWLDRFMPALEPLALLLAQLENEAYDRQRNDVLHGYIRSETHMKKMHARAMAAARQRKYEGDRREHEVPRETRKLPKRPKKRLLKSSAKQRRRRAVRRASSARKHRPE